MSSEGLTTAEKFNALGAAVTAASRTLNNSFAHLSENLANLNAAQADFVLTSDPTITTEGTNHA